MKRERRGEGEGRIEEGRRKEKEGGRGGEGGRNVRRDEGCGRRGRI